MNKIPFNFPESSSPDSNLFFLLPLVSSKLNDFGYKKESNFFNFKVYSNKSNAWFLKLNYNEIIDILKTFMENDETVIEDSKDYTIIKIKKGQKI
jgi:hypothetical protein